MKVTTIDMFSSRPLRRPALPATLAVLQPGRNLAAALHAEHSRSDRLLPDADRVRDELRLAVSQRIAAEEALRSLNAELELRVTERTRDLAVARHEAEARNRVKNTFLATISHELRTPLNAIIGFSDLLLHGLTGSLVDEQTKQIEIINRAGRTMLSLISDLLDISKIEAGKLVLEVEPVSLPQVVEQQFQSVEIEAHAKRLSLELRPGPTDVTVQADLERLRQILGNVLSNAIKYTDEGTISVAWTVGDSKATVWVRDTGIGIPDDDRTLIFQPFHRATCSRSKAREGTGLGLAICDRLLREMGGEIGCESTLGAGSLFWFTVPLTTEHAHRQ
jgi:signal transduction histidine kinase